MERLLNQNDVRMGMQISRNKYKSAPDAQRLTDVANLALEAMRDGKSYRQAVNGALREAGIEKSVSHLYRIALPSIIGKHFKTFPLPKPVVHKPEVVRAEPNWQSFLWDKPNRMREAARMGFERRDHLLPDP